MKSIALMYGWAAGNWHSRHFIKGLGKDFTVEPKLEAADIIIAHSLSCFLVPKDNKARLIVLIGIPYWPGKLLLRSLWENIKVESNVYKGKGLLWWTERLSYQTFYAIKGIPSTYKALRNRRTLELPEETKKNSIILIRNELDSFMHPDIQKLLPYLAKHKLIKLPGGHDDCWLHPEKYVEIIQKEL